MRYTFDQVFVARHGETEWNQERRRQGQLDSPLTALGQLQAERLAVVAGGLLVDGVFSSPLERSVTTAARCADALCLTVSVIEELAEVHHGDMAGLTSKEIDVRFPGEMVRRAADKYRWRFPGGESYADVDRRAGRALSCIAAEGVVRPLIVSHEMIGRMLMRNLLGVGSRTALGWGHPHDVIYAIDLAEHKRTAIRIPLNPS